jgi:hypothetical protein
MLIEVTTPMISTVPLKAVVAISLALILLSPPIPFQTTEVDKLTTFTDTVISFSASEGITYRIKGTNASKFSITTNTGVLTYKAIQTLAHDNDTVIIVATDVAGNEAEKLSWHKHQL